MKNSIMAQTQTQLKHQTSKLRQKKKRKKLKIEKSKSTQSNKLEDSNNDKTGKIISTNPTVSPLIKSWKAKLCSLLKINITKLPLLRKTIISMKQKSHLEPTIKSFPNLPNDSLPELNSFMAIRSLEHRNLRKIIRTGRSMERKITFQTRNQPSSKSKSKIHKMMMISLKCWPKSGCSWKKRTFKSWLKGTWRTIKLRTRLWT